MSLASALRPTLRYAFAQEVTLYRRGAGEVRTEGNGGGLDCRPALAQGSLALAAVWGGAAESAAGGHPLGAGERPPVLGTPADTLATCRVRN